MSSIIFHHIQMIDYDDKMGFHASNVYGSMNS